MRWIFFLLIPIFILSCSHDDESIFTVASWNLNNFFDSRADGTEYDEYLKYSSTLYNARVETAVKLIGKYLGDADLLIFQEVESDLVLSDILSQGLRRKGFSYYGIASSGDGRLAVGFISKAKPLAVLAHRSDDSRLLLDLTFSFKGEYIRVFGIHASSRLSDENSQKRVAELSLLASLMEIATEDIVLAIGDFNIDPRTSEEALANEKDLLRLTAPIVVTGDGWSLKGNRYYNPAIDNEEYIGRGTYYYQGEWYYYDNALLSRGAFNTEGVEYKNSEIVTVWEILDINGCPISYSPSDGSGFSDHLPLLVRLN